jgi:hypothetical protein
MLIPRVLQSKGDAEFETVGFVFTFFDGPPGGGLQAASHFLAKGRVPGRSINDVATIEILARIDFMGLTALSVNNLYAGRQKLIFSPENGSSWGIREPFESIPAVSPVTLPGFPRLKLRVS